MNARVIFLVLWCVCTVPVFATGPDIEFSGVLGVGKEVRVALTKKPQGSTQWVALGSTFDGYVVSSYDPKADVLVLTKDTQQFRLALKQGKTKSGASGKLPEQVQRAILNNLRQLAAAADQYFLENGKTSVTYDELVGPTKYVKQMSAIDGENYRAIQFVQGATFTVTTASGHSVSYRP